MDAILEVSRLILVVPFAVSGLAKLVDPQGARRAVHAWGMPARLVNTTVSTLTLAEIGVAVGLTSRVWAWPSALVAMACLLVPVPAAAAEMARRGANDALMSVLLRSMALGVPTGIVIWDGRAYAGPDLLAWFSRMPIGQQIAVGAGIVVVAGISYGARIRSYRHPDVAIPAAPFVLAPVPLIRPVPELTIGMATYDDFNGVYFTVQALRLYQDLDNTEIVVVDNYGCERTKEFVRGWAGATYVLANEVVGTAAAKNLVFAEASGRAVLCCDSHVLYEAGVIARLKRFYRENPDCDDLLQGPLVYDDGELISTHFEPVWREQMWGIWANDPRGADRDGVPFDIPMQGLGTFSCRADAWLGFHPGFRGFGGEEGYLHEKFRQAGRRCLCLPWLRWMHRFGHPHGVRYPLTIEDKLRNYVLGHKELGLDLTPVLTHFSQYLPADRVARLAETAGRRGDA